MADRELAELVRALAAEHGVRDEAQVSAAERLLGSTMVADRSLNSERALVLNLTTRLIRESRGAEGTRFAKLAANLSLDPALSTNTAWPILYVLSSLSNVSSYAATSGAESASSSRAGRLPRASTTVSKKPSPSVFDAPRGLSRMNTVSGRMTTGSVPRTKAAEDNPVQENSTNPAQAENDCIDESDDEDYYDSDGHPTAAARHAKARAVPDGGLSAAAFAVPVPGANGSGAVPAVRLPDQDSEVAVTSRFAEILLVRDIMLVVQGENGKYVRYPSALSDDGDDEVDASWNHGVRDTGDEMRQSDALARRKRKRALRDLNEVVDILPLPSESDFRSGANTSSRTPVAPCTIHFLRYIAELGFLFKVIYRRLEAVHENPGLVSSNFCSAVEREMESYFRSLSAFRGGPNMDDNQLPTIRTVFVWAELEKPRLRWLARLCDETSSLRGGQTLAHLRHYHKSYVSDDVRNMIGRVIARTAAPLDLMLIRWVSEGVLIDPHREFYIMEDPKVAAAALAASASSGMGSEGDPGIDGASRLAHSASHRIWWGMFKVRREMVPGGLSKTVVANTLVAGKSIAFLRRCCGDSSWVDQVHAPALSQFLSEEHDRMSSRSASGPGDATVSGRGVVLGSGLLNQDPRLATVDRVGELVRRALRSSSMRLKTLFFDKFDLSHHFKAIKNYLLLAQGDFTQALMDSLAPMLDGDGRILRNNITGLLDAALRGSSGFDPDTDEDIAERLDVQIVVQANKDSVGWDVFSLTYRVEDAPLNTVFTTKVMDAYLRIFRFLWRLKRVDYILSRGFLELREVECVWRHRRREHRSTRHKLENLSAHGGSGDYEDELYLGESVFSLLNRAHFLRMKMAHVLQNLQYYCTIEVLEGNWKLLADEMSRAENIDALIDAHKNYLGTIKDRALLSERTRDIAVHLEAVLDVMLDFGVTQKALCEWAVSSSRDMDPAMEDVRRFATSVERVETGFNGLFTGFISSLKSHAKSMPSCTFLLFRLDYNGFFARVPASMATETESASAASVESREDGNLLP